MNDLTLKIASKVTAGALREAEKSSCRICVAVCDANGRLITFVKMDGTHALDGHEAIRKGIAAAGTGEISELSGDKRNRASTAISEGLGFSTRPGGLPMFNKDVCIGGIGVSGEPAEVCVQFARAGISVLPEVLA